VRLAARGALVATLYDGPSPAGVRTLRWDGRTARGRLAPAGVYVLEARVDRARLVRRLVRMR
jgi:flagellar hook assembly protein FlgD